MENIKPTDIEMKWMAARETADADNPMWAIMGGSSLDDCETLALRKEMRERALILTIDHAASCYGMPVAVDQNGNAYGTGDILPARRDDVELGKFIRSHGEDLGI